MGSWQTRAVRWETRPQHLWACQHRAHESWLRQWLCCQSWEQQAASCDTVLQLPGRCSPWSPGAAQIWEPLKSPGDVSTMPDADVQVSSCSWRLPELYRAAQCKRYSPFVGLSLISACTLSFLLSLFFYQIFSNAPFCKDHPLSATTQKITYSILAAVGPVISGCLHYFSLIHVLRTPNCPLHKDPQKGSG